LPRQHGKESFGQYGPQHLSARARRSRDAERERPLFIGRRAAHDGQDHAEPCAGNAEANENLEKLVLPRRDREGRKHQTCRIEDRPQHDRPTIAEPFRDGAEDGLADAPGEVLDRDGQAELRPEPAEFLGDRDLKQPETGADRHAQKQDQRTADEHRGQE
jgi:hypothetical protein